MSGLEVLAYSIDTNLNNVITLLWSILSHWIAAICKGRIGFPSKISSDIPKDSNVIFSTEFEPIWRQSRGILEPTPQTVQPH